MLLIPSISCGRLLPNILTVDTFMTHVFPLLMSVSIILEFIVVVLHGSLILYEIQRNIELMDESYLLHAVNDVIVNSTLYTSHINIILVFPSISLIFHDKADTGRETV